MITIFHNPRCRKSRECLAIIEASGREHQIVRYLDNPLSEVQLQVLISQLDIPPIDLVRTQETQWKDYFKNKALSTQEIIRAIEKYPVLMERPVVVSENEALICRPPEKVQAFL